MFVHKNGSLQAILWNQNLKSILPNEQHERLLFCYGFILEKQLRRIQIKNRKAK